MKYLWSADFEDGHIIDQPEDDRYSKHDDTKKYNPSAFRDIQHYPKKIVRFHLLSSKPKKVYGVNLITGEFYSGNLNGFTDSFYLEQGEDILTDRKLIYYRTVERAWDNGVEREPKILYYTFGYEGKNSKGKVEKKVISLHV